MIQLTIGIVVSIAVLAGQAPREVASDNYTGLRRTLTEKASNRLMKTFQPLSPRISERAVESRQGIERGPCGMPIIVASAAVDPKIIVPIPDNAKRDARIRVVAPAPCGATLANAGRK